MRNLIDFFIKNHLFGNLFSFAVIGIGIASMFLIQREAFPNINFDIISITTPWPAAPADDVEKIVTNPIEQDLKEVDGLKKVQSVSTENLSNIVIFLDPDQTTEAQGKEDIKDVIDKLGELPEGTEDPKVTVIESKLTPILEVSLAGDIPPMELREKAKFLEEELEKIKGVAKIVFRGMRDQEIRVEADAARLARLRVTLDDVVGALKRQNISIPGGIIEAATQDLSSRERYVRTIGEFRSVEEIENTIIRSNDLGQAIRIRDVAKVTYDLERQQVANRTNGQPSLALTVLKKEKADAIDVVDAVRKRVEELKNDLGPQVKTYIVNDFSEYIRRRLSILTSNLGLGLLLVIGFLPLLIPFRFAMLVALGEPFAFLGTIFVLYMFGVSINLLSMIGLIIVSGILVDDSIVVTENAVRLIEKGWNPIKAATEGTLQIVAPVGASLATTSMAFLPMCFMSGIFGKFMVFIPIAVLVSLAVSLFETFFILPAHVAHWIKVKPATSGASTFDQRKGLVGRFLELTRTFWDSRVVPFYLRWLRFGIRRRYVVCAGALLMFFGSLTLAVKGMRFILFPPDGVEIFFIRTTAPTGTSLEQHTRLIEPIEQAVAALPKSELKDFVTSIGLVQQDPNDPDSRRGAEYAQVTVYLTPEADRARGAAEIIDDLRQQVGQPKGLERINFQRVRTGPPTGKPISLGVRGKSYEEILAAVKVVKKELEGIPGVTDITDSYTLGKEEYHVRIKPVEAAAAQLTAAQIGTTVRAVYEGIVATTIRELDEEIDVRVALPKDQRTTLDSLKRIFVPNAMGEQIPLGQVADFVTFRGPAFHEHEDNARQVRVTAEVDVTKTTSLEANSILREKMPEFKKAFPKVSVDFGGEDEDTQESFKSLGRAFILSIIGIFLVLILTFKNMVQPFLVILTIPLGIIAVILAFFVHNMPISFMGLLGTIALSGVIVNNAVIFIDFVNQRRADGLDRVESLLQAASERVRPIFLTTVTTVIGILPTAYGIGGLDKFVVPIAMALGWGIFFGSILTAFVFPAAIAVSDDIRGLLERRPRPSV